MQNGNEENILFSLLIPTKDRLDLLKYAVDSILQQEYKNWEVIISDNCSKEDVQGYVESLQDTRIKYIRQEQPVSVTDNWNTANDLASGDYIIMLGDDDALLPWTLKELHAHIVQYNSPEVLNFGAYIYHQANISEKSPHCEVLNMTNIFAHLSASAPYFLDKKKRIELVQSSLNFVFLFGFNMQYFCYHKNIVTTLKKYGKFYEPPYPDYYTANALMLVAHEVLIIPQDLLIIGVTPKSYGAYYHNNKEKEGMAFHNEADYRTRALASVKDKLCNIAEMQTAAMATFAIVARRFPQYVQLNFAAYYNAVIERIATDYPKEQALEILQAELIPLIPEQSRKLVVQLCVHAISRMPSFKAPPKQSLHLPNIATLIDSIVKQRKEKKNIDVVYLARGTDYGIQDSINFLQSYEEKSAGSEHTLYILAKGWEGKENELKTLHLLASRFLATVIELPDDGLDLGAYYRASLQLTGKYVLFLSTSSRIEHDNWLHLYSTHLNENCPLVGGFGSYELPPLQTAYLQQRLTDIYKANPIKDNEEFQVCKQYLLQYQKKPLEFPNYHIRSNAFLIDRALFMEFMEQNDIPGILPRYKEDAWHLESGRNNLLQYITQKGYDYCIAGANGKAYAKEQWYESNIFRRYNVSNAIISDKQSREFVGFFDLKKMEYLNVTWGETNFRQMVEEVKKTSEFLKLFVIYHKQNHIFSSNFLQPIQSGAENTKEHLGILRDNIGDHISHKNKYFGELTVHYWVWKTHLLLNPHTQHVGFAHYRRFFDLNPETVLGRPSICSWTTLTEKQFIDIVEQTFYSNFLYSSFAAYDMTLTRKMDFAPTTIWDHYLNTSKHPRAEMENFIKILLAAHPEYEESINEVLYGTQFYLSTIFVMRKELFEEFCAWIFPLLFALEESSDWSQYDDTYNEKIAAYLHERAFNIWLVHKLKSTPLRINERKFIMFGTINTAENYVPRNLNEQKHV